MKYIVFLFCFLGFSQDVPMHCGFDWTTYLVVKPTDSSRNVVKNLKIELVDENNNPVLNTNFQWSFVNNNLPLVFIENYKVNYNNEEQWKYNICEAGYFLQLKSDFVPSNQEFYIAITDENKRYKPEKVTFGNSNLYVLCSNKVRSFGPKMTNNPIEIQLQTTN